MGTQSYKRAPLNLQCLVLRIGGIDFLHCGLVDSIWLELVMGGIENFLSRLLKDKIPRYHGILPYSDFSIFY